MNSGSSLTVAERVTLSRAGFTDRQISDHMQKFKNLFHISPFLTRELEHYQRLVKQEKGPRDDRG